jgi:hypothetical protein
MSRARCSTTSRKLLVAPELVARTWAAAKREGEDDITEREVTILLAELCHDLEGAVPRRAGSDHPAALLVERVDVQIRS